MVIREYRVQILYKPRHYSPRYWPLSKAFQLFFSCHAHVVLSFYNYSKQKKTAQYAHFWHQMIALLILHMASKFQVISSKHVGTRAWWVYSIKKRFNSAFQFIEKHASLLRECANTVLRCAQYSPVRQKQILISREWLKLLPWFLAWW